MNFPKEMLEKGRKLSRPTSVTSEVPGPGSGLRSLRLWRTVLRIYGGGASPQAGAPPILHTEATSLLHEYPPNPWEKFDIQGFGGLNSKSSRNVLKLLNIRFINKFF